MATIGWIARYTISCIIRQGPANWEEMTHKAIHYTHHAVREMRKAGIRRSTVRTVLATGERRVEGQRGEDIYYAKTVRIDRKTYEVV